MFFVKERVERMNGEKKLTRIKQGKMIAGVCGGVAKYFGIDVTVIRLAWVLISLFAGCGLLLYIIAIFIMPEELL